MHYLSVRTKRPYRRAVAALSALLALGLTVVSPLWLGAPAAMAQAKKADASKQTFVETLEIAFAAFHRGDWAAAEKGFQEAEKRAGNAPEELVRLDKLYYLLALSQLYQDKWADAVKSIEHHRKQFPKSPDGEEMAFWLGLCYYTLQDWEKAYGAFGDYAGAYPQGKNLDQSRLYGALCLYQQEKLKETADFLKPFIGKLRADIDNQAFLLRLVSLIRSENLDEALAVAKTFDSSAARVYKIVAYHLMVLELGERFEMPEGENAEPQLPKALQAYQLAWTQERVLARQEERLTQLNGVLERMPKDAQGPAKLQVDLYKQLAAEVDKEITEFRAIKDYDTGLNLRQARCFAGMERYREAALLLQQSVDRMPDSDLLAQVYQQLLFCQIQMQSFVASIRTADGFIKRFPDHAEVPLATYLRAESYMRLYDFGAAAEGFKEMATKFPENPRGVMAHFLAGYCLLSLDHNKEGIAWLDEHSQKFPKSELKEQVAYWRAMGLMYDKQYLASREAHAAFVKEYPKSELVEDSTYRQAYCIFREKEYEKAIEELIAFHKQYPETGLFPESNNLLGDAYFAIGKVDEGLITFNATPPRDQRLYDYAVFRVVKGLKATERFAEVEKKMSTFIAEQGRSPRIPEALQELAQYYLKEKKDPVRAKEIYWDAVAKYGPDPEALAVEDLMIAMAKMYKGDEEKKELDRLLTLQSISAREKNQLTLVARLEWLNAQMNVRRDPAAASRNLDEIARVVPPREQPAIILIDVADHLRRAGRDDKAREFYTTQLSWWPRSLYKDRAYAGLGMLKLKEQKYAEALEYFTRYEQEALGPDLLATVMPAKAEALVALDRPDEAIKAYEQVLENKAARGLPAAQALVGIGNILFEKGDFKRAVPYYQRIYILYGSHRGPVATGYLKSAQAFEKLGMEAEAQRTYAEFVAREDLKGMPEYELAQKALKTPPSS